MRTKPNTHMNVYIQPKTKINQCAFSGCKCSFAARVSMCFTFRRCSPVSFIWFVRGKICPADTHDKLSQTQSVVVHIELFFFTGNAIFIAETRTWTNMDDHEMHVPYTNPKYTVYTCIKLHRVTEKRRQMENGVTSLASAQNYRMAIIEMTTDYELD